MGQGVGVGATLVGVPAAFVVVALDIGSDFPARQPVVLQRSVANRLVQAVRQPVVRGGHSLAKVEQPRHREAAFEGFVQFFGRHVPAGRGIEQFQRLGVVVIEELAQAHGVADGGALEAGAGVVAAGGGDGIVVAHLAHGARVVHGDFQALDVDHIVFGVAAYGSGGAEGALGQQIADAVAVGDLLDQVENVLRRTEAQRLSVLVVVAQTAHFGHFHGPGDGGAG